jgi:hypothetical protein
MALKAFLAALALVSVSIGLMLPTPARHVEAQPQFELTELAAR